MIGELHRKRMKDYIPKKLWEEWEKTRKILLQSQEDLSKIKIRRED